MRLELTIIEKIFHLAESEIGGPVDSISTPDECAFNHIGVDVCAIPTLLPSLGLVEVTLVDEETDATRIAAVVRIGNSGIGQVGITKLGLRYESPAVKVGLRTPHAQGGVLTGNGCTSLSWR